MSAVEYLPGDRWLISGPTAAVHLAGEAAAALRWWPRIRDGVTARELVTLLQQDGVLFSAEPFAMIVVEGDAVRVIVGGDTVVLVEDTAGQQLSISGVDLLTWSERVVPDAAVVYVNCATLPGAGDLLPMPAGVVRAGVVRWAVGSDRPVPPSTPEPSAAALLGDGVLGDGVVAHDVLGDDGAVGDDRPRDDGSSDNGSSDDGSSGDPLGVERPGSDVDDVAGDDVVLGDIDAMGDADVVGDDAVTLIGVVPRVGDRPASEPAEAAVPQYIVPGQDPGEAAPSEAAPGEAADPGGDEELEQTVVTGEPSVSDPRPDPDPDPDPDADPDADADADPVHADDAEPQSGGEPADELSQTAQHEDAGAAGIPDPLQENMSHPTTDTDDVPGTDDGSEADVDAGPPADLEHDATVLELPGEVTQTVPPEDLAEHDQHDGADGDGVAGEYGLQDGEDDSHDAPGPATDGAALAGDGAAGTVTGDGDAAGGESLPANPFPRMSLPPFVPPSAPGFVTSVTPGAPTRAPFAPPPYPAAVPPGQDGGPVGASTIHDVPRPAGPPPFVPASTTLPPISVVPGQVPAGEVTPAPDDRSDPDAVATGIPPMPLAGEAANDGSHGARFGPDGTAADARAGDHDGHTVLAESLPEDHRPPPMPPEPAAGQVYASVCAVGHPNAPYAGDCRVCGAPIPAGDPVLVQKPTMAVLRMSSGAVIELDRRVIVGRAPSVSRVASADVPHLVTVASPHGDVSRSHVEVQVDDWHIVVTDLNSTNGTEIHAPGRPVQLLRAGVSVVVEIGWQIDLGDGAGFLVDHL